MWIARGDIESYKDTHIDYLFSKASSKFYIIRICKYYGYSIENLDLLFQSLILSVFTYAIEVRGCAFYIKYLSRIDKLFAMCEGGKGGSKSRITENKTVLSQFRLRVVYSQFTKIKT